MSVLVEAISVIIPRHVLDASYPGGAERYLDAAHATHGVGFCVADDRLTSVSFADVDDVEPFVGPLREAGIAGGEDGRPAEIAYVDQHFGPSVPCAWLRWRRHDEGFTSCWLEWTEPGDLAAPSGWQPERLRRPAQVRDEAPSSSDVASIAAEPEDEATRLFCLADDGETATWLDLETGQQHFTPASEEGGAAEECLDEELGAGVSLGVAPGVAHDDLGSVRARRTDPGMPAVGEEFTDLSSDWFSAPATEATAEADVLAEPEGYMDATPVAVPTDTAPRAPSWEEAAMQAELTAVTRSMATPSSSAAVPFGGDGQTAFDAARAILARRGWLLSADDATGTLAFQARGANARYLGTVVASDDAGTVCVRTSFPNNVPDERRAAVAELVMRANARLTIGNFELDYEDGELRCRTSLDARSCHVTPAAVDSLIAASVLACDRYHHALMQVIYAGAAARDAAASVS